MDPLTHTLTGVGLAQTRVARGPLATATCLIGANLPDVDAATYFLEGDFSLGFRRGWTHGILAMAVLPPLLAWMMLQVDRIRCKRTPSATPVPIRRLAGLSYLAVLSHPVLDWLNTYGVRLLMPFDGRWFYGDALFIVDPWLWLLLGTVALMAHSGSRQLIAGWVALGAVAVALVTGIPGVPLPIRTLWCLGLTLVAVIRIRGSGQRQVVSLASWCFILTTVYLAAMVINSHLVKQQVTEWTRARGLEPAHIMVTPAPADPFRRTVLVADDRHYHRLAFDWLAAERIRPTGTQMEIGNDHPAAAAALVTSEAWGLAAWTRFPRFQVEPVPAGYRVTITDVRFGRTVVELDSDLRSRQP